MAVQTRLAEACLSLQEVLPETSRGTLERVSFEALDRAISVDSAIAALEQVEQEFLKERPEIKQDKKSLTRITTFTKAMCQATYPYAVTQVVLTLGQAACQAVDPIKEESLLY